MKAKLVVEGKEFDIEILDPKLQELIVPKKKTGYERVKSYEMFFFENEYGIAIPHYDTGEPIENAYYECANYYSDEIVAVNNAIADNLMRKLRRFAAEHREKTIDWNDINQRKYFIAYDRCDVNLEVEYDIQYQELGVIYFDSEEATKLAIETFKDELLWYFTEYKDSL